MTITYFSLDQPRRSHQHHLNVLRERMKACHLPVKYWTSCHYPGMSTHILFKMVKYLGSQMGIVSTSNGTMKKLMRMCGETCIISAMQMVTLICAGCKKCATSIVEAPLPIPTFNKAPRWTLTVSLGIHARKTVPPENLMTIEHLKWSYRMT